MQKTQKTQLIRLIVRLPQPVYDGLKERSRLEAVPMAVLVRQAVAASMETTRSDSPAVR
jgi:hypothetical protein